MCGNEEELEAVMNDMYFNSEKYLKNVMDLNKISEEYIFMYSIIKNKKEERYLNLFFKIKYILL